MENNFKSIKDWDENDRPREKFINKGPSYLTDSELLAIIINTGTKSNSAIDIAKQILHDFGGLSNLVKSDFNFLKQIKGLGNAKAVKLAAAFEIGRRIKSESLNSGDKITDSSRVADYFKERLADELVEKFYVVLLNNSNKIIRYKEISSGILNATLVHPREVFKPAIAESAAKIILLHNHPSGNASPSNEDKKITTQLISAGKILNIFVIDHIIVAGDSYFSFADNGLMH